MNVTVSHIRSALQECYPPREAANLSRIVCCEMLGQSHIDYYLGKDMIYLQRMKRNWKAFFSVCAILSPYSMCRVLPVSWDVLFGWLRGCLFPVPKRKNWWRGCWRKSLRLPVFSTLAPEVGVLPSLCLKSCRKRK